MKCIIAFAFIIVLLVGCDEMLKYSSMTRSDMLLQTLAWSMALFSPFFLLGRWGRWPYHVVMTYIFLFEAVGLYVWTAFGMSIGGDWILIAANTNKVEILNFVSDLISVKTLLVIFLAGLFFVAMHFVLARMTYPAVSLKAFALGGILLVPLVWLNVFSQSWRDGLFSVSFTQIVRNTKRSHDSFAGLVRAVYSPELPNRLALNSRTKLPPLGVFVIGESATRNHWSLYGYDVRDTTPNLNSISNELYVFRDVVGCWSATADACRYLMTDVLLEDETQATCTLPEVFKRAGYFCSFYTMSPEPGTGCYDVLDALFKACPTNQYINTKRFSNPRFDADILPILRHELNVRRNEPAMVFAQLGGCHYPFEKWYPQEENVFGAEEGDSIVHYDNAVRYDDRVISAILNMLKQEQRPTFMVYITDHGETPNSSNWRNFPDRDLWELPMFIWYSPSYARAYPEIVERTKKSVNKILQADQLFYGFVSMALVQGCPHYDETIDFLSPRFVERKRRLVLKGKFPYRKDGGRYLR